MNLKDNYIKAVDAYIAEFEKRYKVELEYWVGDVVGEVATFGDLILNFTDVKYSVDNNIPFNWLYNWYYFLVEYGKKCFINLDSYCRKRKDAETNEMFSLDAFEKTLLYDRIKASV